MFSRRAFMARALGLVAAAALPLGAVYAATKEVAVPDMRSVWLVSWGPSKIHKDYKYADRIHHRAYMNQIEIERSQAEARAYCKLVGRDYQEAVAELIAKPLAGESREWFNLDEPADGCGKVMGIYPKDSLEGHHTHSPMIMIDEAESFDPWADIRDLLKAPLKRWGK